MANKDELPPGGEYIGPVNDKDEPCCATCRESLVPHFLSGVRLGVRITAKMEMTITCPACTPPNAPTMRGAYMESPSGTA